MIHMVGSYLIDLHGPTRVNNHLTGLICRRCGKIHTEGLCTMSLLDFSYHRNDHPIKFINDPLSDIDYQLEKSRCLSERTIHLCRINDHLSDLICKRCGKIHTEGLCTMSLLDFSYHRNDHPIKFINDPLSDIDYQLEKSRCLSERTIHLCRINDHLVVDVK